MTEQDIQDAIMEVGISPDELTEIAEDYGIPEHVLRNRINRAYGSVEALAGRYIKQAEVEARLEEERQQKLNAAVERLASQFSGTHPAKGKTFIYNGQKYTFVVLSRSHPRFFARAISHSTFREVGFNRPAYEKFIAPVIN